MKTIALIPARRGSKRLPGKNMALLCGKPLLQHAIESAKESRIFHRIIVSTDWEECVELAMSLGVGWILRPERISGDQSHDFEFVKHALDANRGFDIFAILRPTSPFRTPYTILRAMSQFIRGDCDSMRAVERTRHHPRKSWVIENGYMSPVCPVKINGFPGFDLGTQMLGDVYCQNGAIHIAWTRVIEEFGNVSGEAIRPFFTAGKEGIDINGPEDLKFAEWLMKGGS